MRRHIGGDCILIPELTGSRVNIHFSKIMFRLGWRAGSYYALERQPADEVFLVRR